MTAVRVRLLVLLGVVALAVWTIYPPRETIKLGLDLKGGVELRLRVRTDDALRRQTEQAADALRRTLEAGEIPFGDVRVTGPATFVVEGVDDIAGGREASRSDERFSLTESGRTLTLTMNPEAARALRDDTVEQALQTIERRVNALGVTEPVVARYGAADQILVQLPGTEDVAAAKRMISTTAQLRLTLVEDGPFPTHDAALARYGGRLPHGLVALPHAPNRERPADTVFYVVREAAAVAGTDLRSAQGSLDELNRPAVAFTLSEDAARRFGEFTQAHTNRLLATVLDDRVTSVATIISRIDARGQIVGFDRDEVAEQVIALRSGALPAGLDHLGQWTVGASLGQASVRAGVLASAGSLLFVILFMLAYYRMAGLNAMTSILLNLLILMAFVACIPVTMTLPGIAGLILTVGMGVDSNVLIFERIKEELAGGKTVRAAVTAGFDRVWITIVDTHVASLLAAAFLFQFGTSSIRGFATTLTIGLLANVFTAVFVSKTLFDVVLGRRRRVERLSI